MQYRYPITETHLKDNEDIQIKGYNIHTKNRQNEEGGGIALLIRNDIYHITELLENPPSHEPEIMWINVKIKPEIIIGIYYGKQENTPTEQITNEFNILTEDINQRSHPDRNIILMGDFNAKLTFNTNQIEQTKSRNGNLLQNLLETTNMVAVKKT